MKELLKKIINYKKNIRKKKQEKFFYTKNIFFDRPYKIGEFTYGKPIIFEWDEGTNLKIGKFCSISEAVVIFLGENHHLDWVTTYPFIATQVRAMQSDLINTENINEQPFTKGDVIIGNDVWIGRGTTIMSGVEIGDGAVIGACSVVTKNIAPYEIAAGNPARVIRKRFDEKTIEKLLKLKWWDWDIGQINEEIELLCNNKFDKLFTKYLK